MKMKYNTSRLYLIAGVLFIASAAINFQRGFKTLSAVYVALAIAGILISRKNKAK